MSFGRRAGCWSFAADCAACISYQAFDMAACEQDAAGNSTGNSTGNGTNTSGTGSEGEGEEEEAASEAADARREWFQSAGAERADDAPSRSDHASRFWQPALEMISSVMGEAHYEDSADALEYPEIPGTAKFGARRSSQAKRHPIRPSPAQRLSPVQRLSLELSKGVSGDTPTGGDVASPGMARYYYLRAEGDAGNASNASNATATDDAADSGVCDGSVRACTAHRRDLRPCCSPK